MRDKGKPFSMEEKEEEKEEEEEEEEERMRGEGFMPSYFIQLLFLAVFVSIVFGMATTTTATATTQHRFLSATGQVNYVGRRDEDLGPRSSDDDDDTRRRFDENENRDSSFHDLFGGYFFKPS